MPTTPGVQTVGLDYDFLRYIEVLPETQRRIHAFYLPRFAGCRQVLDLGCGDGDFVALLQERSVDVLGVDSDPKTCAAAAANGLPIVQADVFDYLAGLEPASVDGIFSAHMVEHLPYERVMSLIDAAFRVLRPGGVMVLATPDTRTIFSHLDMFYLHFGHVSFYHPRLLCFLLEHAGFTGAELGANPETASPLLAAARAARDSRAEVNVGLEPPAAAEVNLAGALHSIFQPEDRSEAALAEPVPVPTVTYTGSVTVRGRTIIHRLSYRVRRWLTRWLLKSELDELAASTSATLAGFVSATQATTANLAGHVNAMRNRTRAEQELLWANQQRLAAQAAVHIGQEMAWRRSQVAALENEVHALRGDVRSIIDSLQSINGPFECYAAAVKPGRMEIPEDLAVAVGSADDLPEAAGFVSVEQAENLENPAGRESL
jgi:SAM-dependent methyltransferase